MLLFIDADRQYIYGFCDANPNLTLAQVLEKCRGNSTFFLYFLEKTQGTPLEEEILKVLRGLATSSVYLSAILLKHSKPFSLDEKRAKAGIVQLVMYKRKGPERTKLINELMGSPEIRGRLPILN